MLWVCLNTLTRMLMFTASPQNMRPNNLTEWKCVQWVNDSVFPPQPEKSPIPYIPYKDKPVQIFEFDNTTLTTGKKQGGGLHAGGTA